jgi:hypothetical protein
MQSNHSSTRWPLWMAVAAAWPLQGLAAAGMVQFATGDVQLRRASGALPAVKGAEVESGDIVVTGANGRAQIRFSDGGLVALYPDSHFMVTRYADAGDAAQDQFAVNLVRGGLRAITGWIGKRDARNYKVTTPTALVGIRGSAFLIAFNEQGQLLVSGEQDEIEVCTEAGCVGLKAGESVRVISSSQLPVYTHTRAVLPVPPPPGPMVIGEQLGNERNTPAPADPAPTPPGPVPAPAPPDPAVPSPPPPPARPPGTPAPPAPAPDPGGPPPPGRPQQPPTTQPPPPPVTPAPPPVTRPPIIILRPPILLLPPAPPPVIR